MKVRMKREKEKKMEILRLSLHGRGFEESSSTVLLYPGLVPVENLSWMSFSGEDGVRTLVTTRWKDC
jgi:hypothetical protein